MKTALKIPDDLHPATVDLVIHFAEALAKKLHKAEQKYDYSDGWMQTEWIDNGECRMRLINHISKGDPLDVAAYCAFMWYHKASTNDKADRQPQQRL